MNNIYQIGLMTYKESVRQPLLYIVIAVSALLILLAPLFSLFAFGEEMSLVREVGLAAITFALLLVTILTSNQVITLEIERLTAMTLLSKPVKRSDFILGKFTGIVLTLLLVTFILGGVFIAVYWFKEGLPHIKEGAAQGKSSGLLISEFIKSDVSLLTKGVYFCLLQAILLTSFAVLLSTYFPLVLTAIGCFLIFAIGHVSNYLYQTLQKGYLIIDSLGWLTTLVLPNFTILNVSSLTATLTPLSLNYMLWATLYTATYSSIVIVITIMIFNKREIK